MNMEAWKPTTRQLNVARLLATGDYTVAEASAKAGVPESTIWRWKRDPQFQALVHELWDEAWSRIEGKAIMTGPAAIRIVAEVQAGERDADDSFHAAKWLLDKLLPHITRAWAHSAPAQAGMDSLELTQTVRATGGLAQDFLAFLASRYGADSAAQRYVIESSVLDRPGETEDPPPCSGMDSVLPS